VILNVTCLRRTLLCFWHTFRMYLALGCARGLHALHSYSSTLCHRDIKSMNFLVDAQLEVKIADLELGFNAKTDPPVAAHGAEGETDVENAQGEEGDSINSLRNILKADAQNSLSEYYKADAMVSPWCPPEVMPVAHLICRYVFFLSSLIPSRYIEVKITPKPPTSIRSPWFCGKSLPHLISALVTTITAITRAPHSGSSVDMKSRRKCWRVEDRSSRRTKTRALSTCSLGAGPIHRNEDPTRRNL
jgi:serine/threonine protein kinase